MTRVRKFPAASPRLNRETVQVPSSPKVGNARSHDTVVETVEVCSDPPQLRSCPPDGLRRKTLAKLTPLRSSVAENVAVTVAGPVVVLIETGDSKNPVNVGGVKSYVLTTVTVIEKPAV